MKRKIFLLVPGLDDRSAPVKGAVALAKGLSGSYDTTLVSLNKMQREAWPDSKFKVVSLDSSKGFWNQYRCYKKMLAEASNGASPPVSISFTLPADRLNLLQRKRAVILSSVRVDIARTYRVRYGSFGYLLSSLHFRILRFFSRALSMSNAMSGQLKHAGIRNIALVGNFVDEPSLMPFKEEASTGDKVNFLFLGRLTRLKQPQLLVHVVKELAEKRLDCRLWMAGDGPLRRPLEKTAEDLGLSDRIQFLGYVDRPYHLIQQADYLVLPSLSEGISRSALEALFFGIPCILRDVGAASELIEPGVNGYLFKENHELAPLMAKRARQFIPHRPKGGKCLLPSLFRYDEGIKRYSDLIESFASCGAHT